MNLSEISFVSLNLEKTSFFKYLLLIVLLIGNLQYTQAKSVDSLRNLLSSTTSDTERILLVNELSDKLKDVDLEQSLAYAQEALELARSIDDKEKEVEALFVLGIRLYETVDRDSALAYFEKSATLADEFGFKKLQANNLIKIAKWYRYYRKDSTKAVNYFLKSMEVSKASDYDEGVGRAYAKLASFYTKYKQLDLCEKYLEASAKYYIKIENGSEEIAHYYNEVGDKIWDYNPKKAMDFYLKGIEYSDTYVNLKVNLAKVYSLIKKPEIALEYLEEAIPNIDKEEEKRMLGIATAQLAEVYIQLNNFQVAKKICDEGIALLTPLGRSGQRGLPALYRARGIIAEHDGKDEIALAFYMKSMEEAVRIRFGLERLKGQLTIGVFYLDKNLKKSKSFCRRAFDTAEKYKYLSVKVEACDCLYKIYKKEAISEKALMYFEEKIMLKDSLDIFSVKHALEINRKMSQKDKLFAEQSYQKEIKEAQLKNQYRLNTILVLFSLIGVALIVFLTLSRRKVRKQNIEITEKTNELKNVNRNLTRSNTELERFAYIASHDLKSPLRNIVSFTGLLRRSLNKKNEATPSVKQFLHFIEVNGKRMSKLIEDILEYSKLSNQGINEKEIIDLNVLVNEISQIALSNQDKLPIIKVSPLPNLIWNSSKIYLLLKNIIENGLKYNESNEPTVKVYFDNSSGVDTIFIEDNGIGIKKDYSEKIFIMFQRLHTQEEYEGTGLGLATCKKIVDEFEGNISMSSELGKGTIFKIELPKQLIFSD